MTGGRRLNGALRLRPPGPGDEADFRAACRAMVPDGFTFGLGLEPGMAWDAYLKTLGEHRAGVNLPAYRRRGYATEILRQSLIIARAAGVGRALVICDEGNAGSRAVIEACGGQLESVAEITPHQPRKRRYWID